MFKKKPEKAYFLEHDKYIENNFVILQMYHYDADIFAQLPLKSPPQTKRANRTWIEPTQYWRRLSVSCSGLW